MTKQLSILIVVALLLATVGAFAQAEHLVRVKVPFPFVTAGQNWPAAEYSVRIRTDNGTLTLSTAGITSATMLTTSGSWSGEGRTYLRFLRSGDRWVLQEVALDGTAHVLPTDEAETETSQGTPVAGGSAIH